MISSLREPQGREPVETVEPATDQCRIGVKSYAGGAMGGQALERPN